MLNKIEKHLLPLKGRLADGSGFILNKDGFFEYRLDIDKTLGVYYIVRVEKRHMYIDLFMEAVIEGLKVHTKIKTVYEGELL